MKEMIAEEQQKSLADMTPRYIDTPYWGKSDYYSWYLIRKHLVFVHSHYSLASGTLRLRL